MLELTQQSASGTVTILLQQQVRLTLPETPTTGFSWVLMQECPLLSLQSQDFVPATAALGAGGQHTFLFLATTAGTCSLQLQLRRSWQTSSDQPVLTFHLVISP